MLSRRYYRIKVLQALYAYFQGGEPKLEVAEKNLLKSVNKFHELYVTVISFYIEVIDFYRRRTEDARHKFYPTEEELNPNPKFLENRVIGLIRNNQDLQRQINNFRISWTEEQEMVRKVYQRIRESRELADYLNSGEDSFTDDQLAAARIFKKYIARSPELQFYFEERYIHWGDDFELAAVTVAKTIRLLKESHTGALAFSSLFEKDNGDDPEDDAKFLRDLFRKTISGSQDYEKMISEKTKNWELERIALTDIILIKMALTEFISFPVIPVKVTLNEYIEISKYFSTPKSRMFINGILDKLVEELKEKKMIRKKGRGLI